MDAQEFRKDFLENVKAEAAATGEGSCAAFVGAMAQYLIEAEVLPDFTPSFIQARHLLERDIEWMGMFWMNLTIQ